MARIASSALFETATAIQSVVDDSGLGRKSMPPTVAIATTKDALELYDALITDPRVREASRQLFVDGHFASSIFEAFKCLNNEVKRRSRLSDDGAPLMWKALSAKSPVLKINKLRTQSDRDQQDGYSHLLAGSMLGIRNPRGHETRYTDQPEVALEQLVIASHLMRVVANAKVARRKRSP